MENEGLTALQRVTLIKMYNDIIEIQKNISIINTTLKKIDDVVKDFTDTTFDIQKSISDMKNSEILKPLKRYDEL
jgi:hypothetical protein